MRTLLLLTVTAFSVAAFAQQTDTQPSAKPKKVWTNEDFPQRPQQEQETSHSRTAGPNVAKETAAPKPDESAMPAKRSDELRARLHQAQTEEQQLLVKLARVKQQAETTDDDFRRNMYREAYQNQQITLAEYHKQEATLEDQIKAAEEEERKDR